MTYFYWHDDHIQTFVSAKSALQQLTFSDPLAKLSFAVDASKMAIGVVLQHWPLILEFCSPISFAAYSAVKYFDYMHAGRDFIIFTNHKPLTFLSTGTQNSCLSIKQINMDIIGPLPISVGMKHIVTMVDSFSRWPEVYPVDCIDASTVSGMDFTICCSQVFYH